MTSIETQERIAREPARDARVRDRRGHPEDLLIDATDHPDGLDSELPRRPSTVPTMPVKSPS